MGGVRVSRRQLVAAGMLGLLVVLVGALLALTFGAVPVAGGLVAYAVLQAGALLLVDLDGPAAAGGDRS